MSQPHGLGRGLASLIPQKRTSNADTDSSPTESVGGDVSSIDSHGSSKTVLASPFLDNQRTKISPSSYKKEGDIKTLADAPKSESIRKPSALDNLSVPKKKLSNTAQEKPIEGVSPPKRAASKAVYDVPIESAPPDPRSENSSVIQRVELPVSEEKPSRSDAESILQVAPDKIVPNPHQPRIHFDEDKLTELAQSIKEHGILQPLVVTRLGEDAYELIAGERRLQASKMVGLATVPVIVRDAENRKKFELAIIENIQRHNLNPIEEARAYERLSKEFDMAQEEIAEKMGKSRSAVANTMRLLHLPVEIQRAVMEGKLSEGHAKALLSIANPEKQRALFEMIVREGLTVREAEEKSRLSANKPPRRALEKDPEIKAQEESLSEVFGTKVRINKSGGGGSIRIDYYSPEEFQNILSKLPRG